MRNAIPVNEKYMLTIQEASEYFNIGIKNMRRMAEKHIGTFAILQGNRYLIIRELCEEFIVSCLKNEDGEETL